MTRVRQERKMKDKDMWGSFCSVTSGSDDKSKPELVKAAKQLTDEDVSSFVSSMKGKGGTRRVSNIEAPFFGPARKLGKKRLPTMIRLEGRTLGNVPDVGTLQEPENSKPSTSSSDASTIPSVHIAEVVHVYPQKSDSKIQVQNHDDCDDSNSEYSFEDEKESLQSEMLELCNEIENANGVAASGGEDSSVDLTYHEEKTFQSIIDKVKAHLAMKTR